MLGLISCMQGDEQAPLIHLITVLRLTELQLLGVSVGFCRMKLCIDQGARCATFRKVLQVFGSICNPSSRLND